MAKGGSGPGSGKGFSYRVHGCKVWHEALGLGGIRVRSCDFRIYDEGFGVWGVAGLLVKSHKLRYCAGAWGGLRGCLCPHATLGFMQIHALEGHEDNPK